jgi:ectoine hydroxylase-related dioxygenase (phytanoyl-CoA dioxygenase family)
MIEVSAEEIGSLGVRHLKRFWSRRMSRKPERRDFNKHPTDCVADNTLLCGLRLNNRETFDFIFRTTPTFEQFEAWILEKNGDALDPDRVRRLNAALDGSDPSLASPAGDPPFTREDLDFWNENGYVVLHNAVSPSQCEAAANAIYEFLDMDPNQPGTWYCEQHGHGIWVPLLHHCAFWANRESPRIHRAFAQLWGRDDLWVTVDQGGMNPPERPGWEFQAQRLHFDVSLALPIPFGVQGILYLTDTAANQGAFRCVPGFHRVIESCLANLPSGVDPRAQALEELDAAPIPGRAGDLIIWHHALPHGASPNRADRPRVTQYIKLRPSQWGYNSIWR